MAYIFIGYFNVISACYCLIEWFILSDGFLFVSFRHLDYMVYLVFTFVLNAMNTNEA